VRLGVGRERVAAVVGLGGGHERVEAGLVDVRAHEVVDLHGFPVDADALARAPVPPERAADARPERLLHDERGREHRRVRPDELGERVDRDRVHRVALREPIDVAQERDRRRVLLVLAPVELLEHARELRLVDRAGPARARPARGPRRARPRRPAIAASEAPNGPRSRDVAVARLPAGRVSAPRADESRS